MIVFISVQANNSTFPVAVNTLINFDTFPVTVIITFSEIFQQ